MGCINDIKPRIIEAIILTFTIIGIGFLIWGCAENPWDDISTGGKIFFIIGCACIVLNLLLILLLMCFRIGNKINQSLNGAGKCLSITMLVLEIIGLVAFIISEIIIFINMGDKDDDNYNGYYDDYYYDYTVRRRRTKYSRSEWAAVVCSLTAAEIALALNIVFTDFLIKSIYAKINTPYRDYLNTKNKSITSDVSNIANDNVDYSKSINIYNTPPENGQNVLTFIGYDKDGHPIYSGANQYYVQNNGNINKDKK